MQHPAFYVTGTDTGIGKTMGSTALLHALRARGHRAVGMKPVASGCEHTPQGWRNEDALALQAASDPQPDYATLNPYALPAPLAPELAAADVGVTLARAQAVAMVDVAAMAVRPTAAPERWACAENKGRDAALVLS
ncbi:ATP-dependent dethiobiotin synthetase BioD, partial [Xanthomonas perforans]